MLHRRIARRLAWRKRVLLGFFLLVLGALLALLAGQRAGLLLPLLALFYPARREEARALSYLDRFGLAYRAWLEADPEDPLYPELARSARDLESRVPLPRLPLWEGALLLLLGFGLALGLPLLKGSPASGAPPLLAEGAPAEKAPAPNQPRKAAGTARERGAEAPPEGASGGSAGPSRPSGEEREASAGVGEASGAAGSAAGERAQEAFGRPELEPGELRPKAQGSPPGERAPEEAGGAGGATREPALAPKALAGDGAAPGTPGDTGKEGAAQGPGGDAPGRGAPGGFGTGGLGAEAEAAPPAPEPLELEGVQLPAPWPEGRPPERVRRRAERYLGEVPLTPAQRRVLEGYFGLSEPSP